MKNKKNTRLLYTRVCILRSGVADIFRLIRAAVYYILYIQCGRDVHDTFPDWLRAEMFTDG